MKKKTFHSIKKIYKARSPMVSNLLSISK